MISRNDLYAKRMYNSFVEHAEACEVCKKAAPEYVTKRLCNIGMARAINWEQAEGLVARENRGAKPVEDEAEATKPNAGDEARG
jgi:hypothetical protein